jgi:DNA polymerase-3 subunit delta'
VSAAGEEGRQEADRQTGAPHPRETRRLFGQEAAESQILSAMRAGRLPHALLLTGPRGVGKATLAWAVARFILAGGGAADLRCEPESDVFRLTSGLSHPGLHLVRRPWEEKTGKLRTEIPVDEIRGLRRFFQVSAAHGGARVGLIDAADEMNVAAANALLKLLEEPPADGTLLLVSHRPARLLPTIRSRCHVVRCAPLAPAALSAALAGIEVEPPEDVGALAALTGGSVGGSVRLLAEDGLALYGSVLAVLANGPRLDRPSIVRLAETGASRLDLLQELVALALGRMARQAAGASVGATLPLEEEVFARLARQPEHAAIWASALQAILQRAAHARAVHLDPAQVILDTFLQIDAAAGRAALVAA